MTKAAFFRCKKTDNKRRRKYKEEDRQEGADVRNVTCYYLGPRQYLSRDNSALSDSHHGKTKAFHIIYMPPSAPRRKATRKIHRHKRYGGEKTQEEKV